MSKCMTKKIMIVFGTRPEAIKMGPVIKELKKHTQWFDTIVVVTGQHREQLEQAMKAFEFLPDIDLNMMKEQQSLCYIMSSALTGLDPILRENAPDIVLVHGDTQTTVSAALAAYYNGIPIAHVEAGLRSFDRNNPWPEEINRIMTDALSDLLLAPTAANKGNLISTGYKSGTIFITGQTQIDAALSIYKPNYRFQDKRLNEIDFNKKIILVTAHRRENYGTPMNHMFHAIRRIAEEFDDVLIIYPVHLSPTVQEMAHKILDDQNRIALLPPLEYSDMINLLARSYLVMSDSGGIQEECPVFHKPLILMRETTERPEGIEAGITLLSGTNEDNIYQCASDLLCHQDQYFAMTRGINPFGDGKAAERIINVLAYYFGFHEMPPTDFHPKK